MTGGLLSGQERNWRKGMGKEAAIHDPFEDKVRNLPAKAKEIQENTQKHLIFKLLSSYIDLQTIAHSPA
jgi:hypothetical protein